MTAPLTNSNIFNISVVIYELQFHLYQLITLVLYYFLCMQLFAFLWFSYVSIHHTFPCVNWFLYKPSICFFPQKFAHNSKHVYKPNRKKNIFSHVEKTPIIEVVTKSQFSEFVWCFSDEKFLMDFPMCCFCQIHSL